MNPKVREFIEQRLHEFDQINEERKRVLYEIANYIAGVKSENKIPSLIYICIHNSRRSHFGSIACALASEYFKTPVNSFSGGTEVTAFHPNAVNALRQTGLEITQKDQATNPRYIVRIGDQTALTCFSKIYDDASNPQKDFAAIMMCSEAEQNCPFIPNAEKKFSTPYEDPKSSDGKPNQNEIYQARFAQILRETLYLFSKIKP